MKTNIMAGLLLLISQFSLAQWPVNDGSQGTIIGTVGEARGALTLTTGRIHNGTDCIGTNTNVFSIEADQIQMISTGFNRDGSLIQNNSSNYILMNSGVIYRHVNILSSIANTRTQVIAINSGQTQIVLTQGQLFATMVTGGNLGVHVHVENGALQNYLSTNGYGVPDFSFIDNVFPQFGADATSESIFIFKNKRTGISDYKFTEHVTDEGLPVGQRPTIVYGPIDIVANAYQKRIDNLGNKVNLNFLAPHSLGFKLVSLQSPSQTLFEDFNRLNFDMGIGGSNSTPLSIRARRTIHSLKSSETNPLFIVTNQFINGVATDSTIKTELLKDGDYEITVRAEGTRVTSPNSLTTDKIKKVRLDNYKTYIRKVTVIDQNGLEKYNAEWSELTRPGDGSIILTVRTNEPFRSGTAVTMNVTTSEKTPSLTLTLPIGPDIHMSPVGTEGTAWQTSFTMPNSDAKTIPLKFSSGTHLYGFVLNQNAADVKRAPNTGKFTDQTSVDRSHQLLVCPSDSPLTLDVSVVNGQEVTLSGTGGTAPYEYSIDEMPIGPDHHSTFSSTSIYTIEYDKDYIFKVRDAGGCQAEKYYTLPVVECNALTQAGGQGTETFQVNLGTIPGTVNISYEMYSIPDEIIVTYRGTSWSSGSVSGSGVYSFEHTPVAGESNIVTIKMVAPLSGTAWVFTVNCPSAGKLAFRNSLSINEYKIEYGKGLTTILPTNKNNHNVYDLLYRRVDSKNWNIVHAITLPYVLQEKGEMQIKLQRPIESIASKPKLAASPNPSSGPINIEYLAVKSGTVDLNIFNSDGRILYTKHLSVIKGNNTFNWSPESINAGAVLIKITQDGKSVSTKVLINL